MVCGFCFCHASQKPKLMHYPSWGVHDVNKLYSYYIWTGHGDKNNQTKTTLKENTMKSNSHINEIQQATENHQKDPKYYQASKGKAKYVQK